MMKYFHIVLTILTLIAHSCSVLAVNPQLEEIRKDEGLGIRMVQNYIVRLDKVQNIEELITSPELRALPYTSRHMSDDIKKLKPLKALTLCENANRKDVLAYDRLHDHILASAYSHEFLKYYHLAKFDWKGIVVGCGSDTPIGWTGRVHTHPNHLTIDPVDLTNPLILKRFDDPIIPYLLNYILMGKGIPYIYFECMVACDEPALYKNAYQILQPGGILEVYVSNRGFEYSKMYHQLIKEAGFSSVKNVILTHPHNKRKNVQHFRAIK